MKLSKEATAFLDVEDKKFEYGEISVALQTAFATYCLKAHNHAGASSTTAVLKDGVLYDEPSETSTRYGGEIIETLKKLGFIKFTSYWVLLREKDFSNADDYGRGEIMAIAHASLNQMRGGVSTLQLLCVSSIWDELMDGIKDLVVPGGERKEDKMVDTVMDITDDLKFSRVNNYIGKSRRLTPPEFYPNNRLSIKDYAQEFLGSDSRALLLLGPTGTGKTSFIRELLIEMNVTATICSDTELLQKRALYSSFARSSKQVLVIEDADAAIMKRDRGNPVMAGILGILDGVVSSDKRIIISTNLDSTTSVDTALLRPGRLHDLLRFGYLTIEQAQAARAAIGKPPMENVTHKQLTLSESLNYEMLMRMTAAPTKSLGFTG
jgi:hypothetical protein